MTPRGEARLWLAQRASAGVLGLAVVVHLVTIIYAVHAGLSASAILARLRGNHAWAAFYFVFAVAAAVHAPIGLRTAITEMTAWRGRSLDGAALVFALALFGLGARAILSLTGGF